MSTAIRQMRPEDYETVLELNAKSVVHLAPLSLELLSGLVTQSEWSLVIAEDARVLAFMIVLLPGANYESANYRWFENRFAEFSYVDRVVVDEAHRRSGIASLLYDEIEHITTSRVVLEVHTRPSNLASMAFHRRRGYEVVGSLAHPNGVEVAMLEKRTGNRPT